MEHIKKMNYLGVSQKIYKMFQKESYFCQALRF